MASPMSSSSEFDAASIFAESLMDQINKEDVKNMVSTQKDMLSRFEKTNEMLINFNILSSNRFTVTSQEFKKHTQTMYEMKKDLDSIFKRIRTIKTRLGKVYPEAFTACQTVPLLEDEEDEEQEQESRPRNQSAASHSILAENRSKRYPPRRTPSGKSKQKDGPTKIRQASVSETDSKRDAAGNRDSVRQTGDNDKETIESANDNDGPKQINRSGTS